MLFISLLLACKPEEPKESDTAVPTDDSGTNESTPVDDSGDPTGDPDKYAFLVGSTYSLNLSEANITQPPTVGALLVTLVEIPVILVGVTSVSTELGMMGAMAGEDGMTQNFCAASFDFPPADFSAAPTFAAGPTDFSLSVQGSTLILHQLELGGTFAEDGSYYGDGTMQAVIDMREIEQSFSNLGYTADEICSLVAGFGAACEPCGDAQNYCLTLGADSITAAQVSGSLESVQADNCPGCETGEPVCE